MAVILDYVVKPFQDCSLNLYIPFFPEKGRQEILKKIRLWLYHNDCIALLYISLYNLYSYFCLYLFWPKAKTFVTPPFAANVIGCFSHYEKDVSSFTNHRLVVPFCQSFKLKPFHWNAFQWKLEQVSSWFHFVHVLIEMKSRQMMSTIISTMSRFNIKRFPL